MHTVLNVLENSLKNMLENTTQLQRDHSNYFVFFVYLQLPSSSGYSPRGTATPKQAQHSHQEARRLLCRDGQI